jgi:hypothetical protein
MSGPEEDELARLQRELVEADAAIAELTRDNEVLTRRAARSGSVLPQASGEPFGAPQASLSRPAPSQVYRSPDPRIEAEEALAKANATVATLRIEQAILQSQSAARMRRWYAWRPTLLALPAILGLVVLLWFASGSARIFVFVAFMLVIGGVLVHLIGTIPPRDGPPPPTPPLYPGL